MATVAKDQQQPQSPWSLTLVMIPDFLQSSVEGADTFPCGSSDDTFLVGSSRLRISKWGNPYFFKIQRDQYQKTW